MSPHSFSILVFCVIHEECIFWEYVSAFCRMSLNLVSSDVSLWLDSCYVFLSGIHRSGGVSCSVHHIRRHLVMISTKPRLRLHLPCFSTERLLFLFVMNWYLVRRYIKIMNTCHHSSQFCPLVLASLTTFI